MDHPGIRVGSKNGIRITLDQPGLIPPARLAFPLSVVFLKKGKQAGIGRLSLPELVPDALWVRVEKANMLVDQHRLQASLEVVLLPQVTELAVKIRPHV